MCVPTVESCSGRGEENNHHHLMWSRTTGVPCEQVSDLFLNSPVCQDVQKENNLNNDIDHFFPKAHFSPS